MLKALWKNGVCLVGPLLFCLLGIGTAEHFAVNGIGAFFFFPYLLSIALILFCIKTKFCNLWILSIGFILPLVYLYIEHQNSANGFEQLEYSLMLVLTTAFYSIPFFVTTIVLATAAMIKIKKRRLKEVDSKHT